MRLAKIKIRGLRSIIAFERDLTDEWFDEISPAVLVTGLNGAGKTTLLETIAQLWGDFGQLLRARTVPKRMKTGLFKDCQIAAIQLRGILSPDEPPTWLFVADQKEFEEHGPQLVGCQYCGIVRDAAGKWHIVSSDPAWRAALAEKREQSLVDQIVLPNIVYITSDERRRPTGKVEPVNPEMNWLAVYRPEDADIHGFMLRAKAEDPEMCQTILSYINALLVGKQIIFDNEEILVRATSGGTSSMRLISTGEWQIVLLITFVSRYLRDGGVFIVDEPDIHLHVSEILAMVDTLLLIADDRNAQIILVSHNPEIWRNFERPSQRIELTVAGHGKQNNTTVFLRPLRTLEYYDGIILCTAGDDIGGSYIGMAVDDDGIDKTIYCRITPNQLEDFLAGRADLLSTLNATSAWGITDAAPGIPVSVSMLQSAKVPVKYLPDRGFFLTEFAQDPDKG